MRHLIAVLLVLPIWCQSQANKPTAPSKEEISELLAKAEEKVSGFEDAVTEVKPLLENQQTDILSKDANSAAGAHKVIRALKRNGPSAYGLVALISALDDITLNASKTGTIVVLTGKGKIDAETQAKLTLLWTAQNSCSDISELLLHATLRLIQVEENILKRFPDEKQ